MQGFRITKYDPGRRDDRGVYLDETWTSMSDIGKEFGGVVFSREEYERTEEAYLYAVDAFLAAAHVPYLVVRGLEKRKPQINPEIRDGEKVPPAIVLDICREMLREGSLWCRLEGVASYVHIGYDYYMYIGVDDVVDLGSVVMRCIKKGLYVERDFESPYCELDR